MNRTTLTATLLIAVILLSANVVFGMRPILLFEDEQQAMSNTFQYSLEYNKINQAANWTNPETGRSGAVVPIRTYIDTLAHPCREYITSITTNGRQQRSYGAACRQNNGVWYVMSERPPVRLTVTSRSIRIYDPPEYYYVPPLTYYNPYPIYFSFSYLFHGGSFSVGNYYPSGRLWYPRTPWYYKRYHSIDPFRHRHRPHHRDHIRR